jgi:hypothetical protein
MKSDTAPPAWQCQPATVCPQRLKVSKLEILFSAFCPLNLIAFIVMTTHFFKGSSVEQDGRRINADQALMLKMEKN